VMVLNIIQVEKHIYTTDTGKKFLKATVLYFIEYGVQIGGETLRTRQGD